MVSTEMRAAVKLAFEALEDQKLDIHQYSPPLFDVVFEIFSADSFIAGIAGKILDRDRIVAEETAILDRPLLQDRRWWRLENGELFDLEPYQEVSTAANALDNLRARCKAALGS
jgi:hypothetical protein